MIIIWNQVYLIYIFYIISGFSSLFRRNGRQGIERQGGLLGGLFSSGLWIVPVSAVAFLGVIREELLDALSKIFLIYKLKINLPKIITLYLSLYDHIIYILKLHISATTTTTTSAPTTSFGNYYIFIEGYIVTI